MHSIYSIYDATSEDWAAILGLAHHWQFGEVKSLVVRELEKQVIPSIYKIVIYHRYDVDRGLLLPSYTDLVSREETLSIVEAKDLGLETSLMIMTAREIVRKGDAPTSTVKVSPEELRNIIRQVFQFPGLRSESPLSDTTAAEPVTRSPPPLEKSDLPTVPENQNESAPFSASASLNSSVKPGKGAPPAPAPIIAAPTPPTPAPSTQNKQGPAKPASNPNKQASTVNLPKEDLKSRENPFKQTSAPKEENELKPAVQELTQPVTEAKPKNEPQENTRLSFSSRLADATKGLTSAKDAATSKDKDGQKPTDNKEAKNAKDATNKKDTFGPPPTGQVPSETPNGTPLLNQDSDQPGTPTTGQSVMICYPFNANAD